MRMVQVGLEPRTREQFGRRLIAFRVESILGCRQQHAVCDLVALLGSIVQYVQLTAFRIQVLDSLEKALREDVIDLGAICVEGGRVVKVSIPKIEKQVDRARTIELLEDDAELNR